MELYESGIDYIDLSSDNSIPGQDKLLIHTRDEYMNTEYKDKFASRELSREDVDYEEGEREDDSNELSDEDINGLV